MMRHALSMLGGIALAVGLFWMLALLVAPPEQQVDEPIMTMSMTMVEAPEVASRACASSTCASAHADSRACTSGHQYDCVARGRAA